MLDLLYKISRKYIPIILYNKFSNSIFGRAKKWERIENYFNAFSFYAKDRAFLSGKIIAEVGSGCQLYTALFFLESGAERVILIDPKWKYTSPKFNLSLETFNQYSPNAKLTEKIFEKIEIYTDLLELPKSYNDKIEFIGSYLVLEHLVDIEPYFEALKRLLSLSGTCRNKVDLSDHTYHIFGKYLMTSQMATRRILYHLRYSNLLFSILNDSKCYMNRILLPDYLMAMNKYGFKLKALKLNKDENCLIHKDLIKKYSNSAISDLQVIDFEFEIEKDLMT